MTIDLRSALREAGLRVTMPRLAVLEFLDRERGHWTADGVHSGLDRGGVSLTRATVYNVLGDLESAGLVQRPAAGPGPAHFEWPTAPHHHFVCRDCGLVEDVPAHRAPRLRRGMGQFEGARVDEVQIVFRGLCAGCVRV